MKRVIFGFASKLKRNYWFLPLIVLLLLLSTLILSSVFEVFSNINAYNKAYKDEYNDYISVTFGSFGKDVKTYGELREIFPEGFLAEKKNMVPLAREGELCFVSRINQIFARNVKCPVVGNWYSDEIPEGYREGIVTNDLKAQYKIGEFYETKINVSLPKGNKNYPVKFKVIGYFEYSTAEFSDLFPIGDLRDTVVIQDYFYDDEESWSIFLKGDESYYQKQFGAYTASVEKEHERRVKNDKDTFSQAIYLFLLTFSLAIGAMMGNTLLKEDYERRRNSVYFICGQSKKTYLLTKLFEMLVVLAFSAIIYFGVLFPISESIVELIFINDMYLSAGSAVAGFATIYGLYALAEGFYIFKTMRSNFLEEVGRE